VSVYVGVVVGVSLLRNALAGGVGGGVVERALAGDADAERELGLAALGGRLGRGLLEFACGDVEGCCAELSTVSALRRAVPGRFRVEFFYTDTKASWLCAVTMAECLGRGVLPDVEVVGSVQVPLFGGDPEAALSSLVDVVGRRLYGAVSAGADAYVVVTGGTKAEAVWRPWWLGWWGPGPSTGWRAGLWWSFRASPSPLRGTSPRPSAGPRAGILRGRRSWRGRA